MEQTLETRPQRVCDLRPRGTAARRGARYHSQATLFGLPVFDLAVGPSAEKGEARGHARGIIAIGDTATGVLALGGVARGLVALGGVAFGIFSAGGVAAGLLTAAGGVAGGALAAGGVAIGLKAAGGVAIGIDPVGGLPIKWRQLRPN